MRLGVSAILAFVLSSAPAAALTTSSYWNVFNIEGESNISASLVTYDTLADMLSDTNRTGIFDPNPNGFGVNIVGSGSDGSTFWNVFNIEGENNISASLVTYDTLTDMLADTNRTGVFDPNPNGFGVNIVGSGSDGSSYWNVFNIEGESNISASLVTYDTLTDMLSDTNRTGVFDPNPNGFGRNIVGSGSDGSAYWNVFNIEGESNISASLVTYDTLTDMLSDTNRTGVFDPNPNGFGVNIVGSGAFLTQISAIPAPASLPLLAGALVLGYGLRRKRSA